MGTIKPTYEPKNPMVMPIRRWSVGFPVPLLEKLDLMLDKIEPKLTRAQFMSHYVLPQFDDWLGRWLELKAPKDGERVLIEAVQIFPLILHQKRPRRK